MRISEAQGSSSGIQLLFKARFHAVSVLITEWGQSLHSVHVTFFLFFFFKVLKGNIYMQKPRFKGLFYFIFQINI